MNNFGIIKKFEIKPSYRSKQPVWIKRPVWIIVMEHQVTIVFIILLREIQFIVLWFSKFDFWWERRPRNLKINLSSEMAQKI